MRRQLNNFLLVLFTLIMLSTQSHRAMAQADRSERVHNSLNRILSGSEFHLGETQLDPIAKAWNWCVQKVKDFFNWLGKLFRITVGGVGGGIFGVLFYWLLLAALVAGMVLLAMKVVSARKVRLQNSFAEPNILSTHDLLEQMTDPDNLMSLADELANRGEFRLAYRAVYLATLHRLDIKGYIKFDVATTNGEYIRAIAVAGPKPLFRAITLGFDLSWYGNRDIREQDYKDFRSLTGQLTNGLDNLIPSS